MSVASPGPGDGGRRDPLRRDVRLEHETSIPVLGIPVRFRSNSGEVLEIVERAFGPWRVVAEDPDVRVVPEARVTFIVEPVGEGAVETGLLRYRVPDDRVVVYAGVTEGIAGVADPVRRESLTYVTPELIADRERFRYGVVEAMTMALVTHFDRQPIHAAALMRDGAVLLLAGRSGVGKSTLCYTALREGYGLLSEDIVFLQRRPRTRVWGMPGFVHLPAGAEHHFPELRGLSPSVQANGKEKIAVAVGAGSLPGEVVSDRPGICVLRRGEGAPRLERLTPEQVEAQLTLRIETGFDIFDETFGEAVHRLAAGGGWQLTLAGPPTVALPFIARMFEEMEGAAAVSRGPMA